MARPVIQRIHPGAVVPGGRLAVAGQGFDVAPGDVPQVAIGGQPARVVRASSREVVVEVPDDAPGGRQAVTIEGLDGATPYVEVGRVIASGVHQVDGPVFDADGRLYATLSGSRGQQTPVSIYRIELDGTREPWVTGLGNATSMAMGPDGLLYVSSRFDGVVWRVTDAGTAEKFATDLGAAFGLAFDRDGTLLVGDRSGSIHRVQHDGRHAVLATVPASVAAFHLALAPDGALLVAAPTLNSSDALYRVTADGVAERWLDGFGRPQGLGFDSAGRLHVVDALAGDSAVYRVAADGHREVVVSGRGLLGVAFNPVDGAMIVCTDDTIYGFLPATRSTFDS